MSCFFPPSLSSLVLVVLAFVFQHASVVTAQTVLLPTNDPFYIPPAGFEKTWPGTILRNRTIVPNFASPAQSYQLLYRTTAINGTPIATVTTIFVPHNASKDSFISFQTVEDSANLKCSPSYNYQNGSATTDNFVTLEELAIQSFLAQGYIVSSPDHEGPDAAFSAGRLEGRCTLDSMRAVNHFYATLGLNSCENSIVGVGYSGGALATGWAASLQPTYARELNIKGWISGGTPANLTGALIHIDGTATSGLLIAALDGLMKPSAYAAQLLQSIYRSALTPFGKSMIDFASKNCIIEDGAEFQNKSILSTDFQKYGPNLLQQPDFAKVLSQCTMGVVKAETPRAPYLLYHAEQDEVIPYADAAALYHRWCDYGANVHFTTYSSGAHGITEVNGLGAAVNFAKAAFAGNASSGGCSTSTV